VHDISYGVDSMVLEGRQSSKPVSHLWGQFGLQTLENPTKVGAGRHPMYGTGGLT